MLITRDRYTLMQAFISAVSAIPLVASASESEWTKGRVVVNIRTGYILTGQSQKYDTETEAANKQIDALAEEFAYGPDGVFAATPTSEVWYYRPE